MEKTNSYQAEYYKKERMMTINLPYLLTLSQVELDDLFRKNSAGDIPVGDSKGIAICSSGTFLEKVLASIARWFFWQGKVFDSVKGELLNKIGPFGMKALLAKVYKDKSWFDGKECITLDYSKSFWLVCPIRDEIRLIAPGIYLGIVFVGKKRLMGFALQF